MKKLTEDINIRICNKCGKKKVLEIGFYLHPTGKDGYSSTCKACKLDGHRLREEKKHDGVYLIHKWTPNDENNMSSCVKCGLERKQKALPYKKQYITTYLINKEWTNKRPICVSKNEK